MSSLRLRSIFCWTSCPTAITTFRRRQTGWSRWDTSRETLPVRIGTIAGANERHCFNDSLGAPRLHARRKEEERLAEKRTPLPKPPPIKSDKEKAELRRKMRDKYEAKFDIPERILYMALESVLYDEDQANNLM